MTLLKTFKITGFINDMHESPKYHKIFIANVLGLVVLDEQKLSFKTYNTTHGLPNQEIQAILEDKDGLIWLSTKRGLVTFDPIKEKFRTYSMSDGLAQRL